MSESTPRVGQVRQRYDVEAWTQGAGLTQQHHLTGVTSEAWTGTEWVDVRELVAAQETLRRVEALAERYDELAIACDDGPARVLTRSTADRIRRALAGES